MAGNEEDLFDCVAMVVDGNPTSRSILISQLRDFGVGTVVQCARLADARRQLEFRKFDVVLCEQHFPNESSTGQDLLDDLRRNHLLPFSTIFIMITAEATYAKVAEAAESALDGYLLKPHTATNLGDRLRQARVRKLSLQEIYTEIEAEEFQKAADLCLQRFETRGKFWLYAARVGAELMLRLGEYARAQAMYEAVVAAKTLPWAKLGVARAQLDSGQPAAAASMLENLISDDPSYADAYDVMGRAQFEMGKFDKALETYKMAADLTPASISRMQNLGMMTFYSGDRQEAEKVLDKTVRMGLDSKMFDCQTLVLLAFARLESGDRKGLQRCRDDFARLLERHPKSARHRRLSEIVDALSLIQQHQFAKAVEAVRQLAGSITQPEFDFESATNLLALLAQLANRAIQLDDVETSADTLAMRFCASRSLSELLAGACAIHPPYAERVRAGNAQVLKLSETAMALSLAGDPRAAVSNLLHHGKATLNSKLIETAYLVLQRYATKIADAADLMAAVQELRARYGTASTRPGLGEQQRQAGGLTLRAGSKPKTSNPSEAQA
jgi:cytochrome c-type biogenesis protein CcmH/NrfG